MSTFFQQTAQAMIAKHIDRFPLLKLDQVIDWQPIEQYLNRQRTRYVRDHRGRPAYPLLSMFKAVLLGQWHSLSDPELEHSLITRIDFNLFCRFDELSIPDYSTLCRYRNWLAQDDTLSELLQLINRQLTEKNLKVEKASAAVIDATIIQTAGSKQRQAIEVDEEGQVSGQTTPSKDKDARWIKKNGLYKLGYKQHTCTDASHVVVFAARTHADDAYLTEILEKEDQDGPNLKPAAMAHAAPSWAFTATSSKTKPNGSPNKCTSTWASLCSPPPRWASTRCRWRARIWRS